MLVAPSVLSFDYSQFYEEITILNKEADWLHFDVMDGHFVPNLSFGPDILKAFRKNSSLFMDVHIMVSDPDFFAPVFIKAGADQVTFHYEAVENDEKCHEVLKKIRGYYVKAGLSIKPDTPVEKIYPFLEETDTVLVMSVYPGFGGQKFIEESLDRVKKIADYRKEHGLNFVIEVDGGVDDQNARRLMEAGADCLVAGSFVFKGDIERNIAALKNCDKEKKTA